MKKRAQNLHVHTTISDGEFGHLQTLDIAHRYETGVIAFTDHDAFPDQKTIKFLRKNENHPVKWIMGIEISSDHGLHIVGLFVDPTNKPLMKHCQKAQKARTARMKAIVKNLQKLGFKINTDECLKASGGEVVGRPHIVKALKSKRQNLKIIEQLVEKMRKDTKKDSLIKQKFEQMINQGEGQYPYVLFLTDDAYLPGIYVDYLYRPSLKQTAGLIRGAGGLAIIAHYMLSTKKKFPPEQLAKAFEKNDLDGGEVLFGLWAKGTRVEQEVKKDEQIVRRLVKEHNKVASAGMDAHCRADWIKFAKDKLYSQKTTGTIEKIIKRTRVDTTWSSLK